MLWFAPLNQLRLGGDAALLVLGTLGLLEAGIVRRGRLVPDQRQLWIVIVWIMVTTVGIVWWPPIDFDRYFLPLQPCAAVLEAFGAAWLARLARAALSSRARQPAAEAPRPVPSHE